METADGLRGAAQGWARQCRGLLLPLCFLRPGISLPLLKVSSKPSSVSVQTSDRKAQGAKSPPSCRKMASTFKDTQGILQSHGQVRIFSACPDPFPKSPLESLQESFEVVSQRRAGTPKWSFWLRAAAALTCRLSLPCQVMCSHGCATTQHRAAVHGEGLIRTPMLSVTLLIPRVIPETAPLLRKKNQTTERYETFLLSAIFLTYRS